MNVGVPVAAGEAGQASPLEATAGTSPLPLPSGAFPAQLAAPPPELHPPLPAALVEPTGTPPTAAEPTGTPLSAAEPGRPAGPSQAQAQETGALPAAGVVLAVIARPGQESADLGAVLSAFRLHGASLAVLCLTRGEGSEVNSTCERLEVIRPWELQVAAGLLGVSSVTIADYPDGRLSCVPPASLAEHIRRTRRRTGADLLLVADPAAAADPDVVAVAQAACLAARRDALAVLARTMPGPGERWPIQLGREGPAVRRRQRRAIGAHASQVSAHAAGERGPGTGTDPDDRDGCGDADPRAGRELVRWLVPPVTARPANGQSGG